MTHTMWHTIHNLWSASRCIGSTTTYDTFTWCFLSSKYCKILKFYHLQMAFSALNLSPLLLCYDPNICWHHMMTSINVLKQLLFSLCYYVIRWTQMLTAEWLLYRFDRRGWVSASLATVSGSSAMGDSCVVWDCDFWRFLLVDWRDASSSTPHHTHTSLKPCCYTWHTTHVTR